MNVCSVQSKPDPEKKYHKGLVYGEYHAILSASPSGHVPAHRDRHPHISQSHHIGVVMESHITLERQRTW